MNERADVANHPFFTNPSTEAKANRKSDAVDDKSYKVTTLATSGTKDRGSTKNKKDDRVATCPICAQCHPLCR